MFFRKNGIHRTHHPNGKLKSEHVYKKGKLHGPFTVYSEDGSVIGKGTYKDDELNGIFETYYPSGELGTQRWYVDGLAHGESKTYDRDGRLLAKCEYKRGTLTGKITIINQDGIEKTVPAPRGIEHPAPDPWVEDKQIVLEYLPRLKVAIQNYEKMESLSSDRKNTNKADRPTDEDMRKYAAEMYELLCQACHLRDPDVWNPLVEKIDWRKWYDDAKTLLTKIESLNRDD